MSAHAGQGLTDVSESIKSGLARGEAIDNHLPRVDLVVLLAESGRTCILEHSH